MLELRMLIDLYSARAGDKGARENTLTHIPVGLVKGL